MYSKPFQVRDLVFAEQLAEMLDIADAPECRKAGGAAVEPAVGPIFNLRYGAVEDFELELPRFGLGDGGEIPHSDAADHFQQPLKLQ